MATLPVTGMIWTVQVQWKLSQLSLMRVCGACLVFASVIFFPQISDKDYVATPYLILLGLGVTLGAGIIASSIIGSLAMRCALPGTYYTVENLLILDSLVEDSVCKTLAPPFARYLLEMDCGGTLFACLQAMVCMMGFTHVRAAAQKCGNDGGSSVD
jgi:hypothetical protein